MFIRDNLQKLKVISETDFPNTKFLFMFFGVVTGLPVLYVIDEQTPVNLWQSSIGWELLVILLLVMISASIGLMMFRSKSDKRTPPSISTDFC